MTYQHAGSDSVRTQSLPETAQEPKGGWIGPAAFVLSIALIAFLAGAWTVLSRVPPYKLLTNAHDAAGALYAQATQYGDRYQTDLWYDARSDDKGVVAHDAATALEGYTLYTSSHEPSAFLVDMKGREVHRWFIPPEKIWTEDVEAAGTLGPHIYIRKSYMYPNGDPRRLRRFRRYALGPRSSSSSTGIRMSCGAISTSARITMSRLARTERFTH